MNSIEFQAIYRTNEVFFIGARYLNFNSYSYFSDYEIMLSESVFTSSATGYSTSFNDISLLFGMEFGNFNERFQLNLNLLTGFAFANRKYAFIDNTKPYIIINKIISTEDLTFFSPSFEFGLSCYLTQNFIINTTLSVKLVKVKNMNWYNEFWLIQLSEKDAFLLYTPVRLIIRF